MITPSNFSFANFTFASCLFHVRFTVASCVLLRMSKRPIPTCAATFLSWLARLCGCVREGGRLQMLEAGGGPNRGAREEGDKSFQGNELQEEEPIVLVLAFSR
jgi:hypothetical protein